MKKTGWAVIAVCVGVVGCNNKSGAGSPVRTGTTTSTSGSAVSNAVPVPAAAPAPTTASAIPVRAAGSTKPASTTPTKPASSPTTTKPATTPAPTTPAPAPATPAPQQPAPTTSTFDPHLVLAAQLINDARAAHGLPPVKLDKALNDCALRHSEETYGCAGGAIQNFGRCGHVSFIKGDYCGAYTENQGVGTGSIDAAFKRTLDQMIAEGPPPAGQANHYSNIMNPLWTTLGVGEYVDPNGVVWITHLFR